MKKLLSLFLACIMLAALAGCGAAQTNAPASTTPPTATTVPTTTPAPVVLGEGETAFELSVTSADGTKEYTINTSKQTLGDALLEVQLIEGTESEFGLYVTTVDGVAADESANEYWAFYINDEMAATGVSSTNIEDGKAYALKLEKW
ncbi:MAG: DUF4430 domain-containing protein [Oscillospiraceae bacterium]|jgi:type IV pilus biogenesis protein CpaD/CtpE|nr:DUF4430 domain-containing protein [Oscillospiraceae bacterium]